MRQKQNRDGSRVERVNKREQSKDQSRRKTRTDQRRKQREREKSAGRDENKAPAETKAGHWLDETRLETETKRERENTSNDNQTLELVRRALLYRKSAMAAASCSTWRVIFTSTSTGAVRCTCLSPLSQLTRAARALLNKMHACDNTAYIIYMYSYIIRTLASMVPMCQFLLIIILVKYLLLLLHNTIDVNTYSITCDTEL